MNVGILSPRSNAYPGIGFEFFDGLKGFLQKNGLMKDVNLFSENIGFGSNEKEVYEKTDKLLLQNDMDVVVAYADLRILPILEPLIFTSGKLFIVINPGANYPYSWIPKSNTVFLTLHDAFLCGLTGTLAGEKSSSTITASTFYDCGYLHVASMVNNFMENGGRVLYHYVNKQQPYKKDDFSISELLEFLFQNKEVNSVLSNFDSLPASFFYEQINSFERAEELQLYASPMMLQQQALADLPYKFSITGHVTWLPQLQHPLNGQFIEQLEQVNKKASLFSLLGWECGLILQQAFKQKNNDGTQIVNALKSADILSPRGALKLDENTNYLTAPSYRCSIPAGSSEMHVEMLQEDEAWKKFTSKPVQGITSGWTNTYLCY